VTRFHVVGIGGAGMSAIALLLLGRGHQVSGSDQGEWPLARACARAGAVVHASFDPAHLEAAEIVVRSSAYGEGHVEVRAALERGLPVWRRQEAWQLLSQDQRVVAIAGTHGKTTTTALTWHALRSSGIDASLICGAALVGTGANAHVGRDPVLVIEADEYDRAFQALQPEVAVVTNVDHDHVDVFPTRDDVVDAFRGFSRRIVAGGTLVACADDPGSAELARWGHIGLLGRSILTYGTSPFATYRIGEVVPGEPVDGQRRVAGLEWRHTRFTVQAPEAVADQRERRSVLVQTQLAGMHNVRNATAALAVVATFRRPLVGAAAHLKSFEGTERRLEPLGSAGGVAVIDDYAHHPAEIRAAIEAVRGAHRLAVVFQPHTPSRLRAFFDQFVGALRPAQLVVVAETFASAREAADAASGARALAEAVGGAYAADPDEAARALAERVRPGDLVLVLGAGDIRRAGERLLELLGSRAPA
jgi:UDP-N-acetylmuramate--alanine ligase